VADHAVGRWLDGEERARHVQIDPAEGEAAFARCLRELSLDPQVDAITLERPLPQGFDVVALQELIAPEKDVEGMNARNVGRLVSGAVVVVGAGFAVGRPVALLLLDAGATVEVCHVATRDLAARTRHADVIVACAGVPGLITAAMVKPGAVVVDVGTTVVLDERGERAVRGDVAPEVASVASALTPVPGGVGPVTVALILRNAVRAARSTADALEKVRPT
jgi:methylenetetrahydrofolate dehydrogenase (NADP+)/methenyltetrahydrofolate cyclohydrolase